VRAKFSKACAGEVTFADNDVRDSTNQAHGLIRTEPDVIQSYASRKSSERNMLAPMERWRTARRPKKIVS
jgi:hypothetical protein